MQSQPIHAQVTASQAEASDSRSNHRATPADHDGSSQPIRFRPRALRRYQTRTESPATLRVDSGRRVAMLWPGLLLLIVSGVILWARTVPIYVSALAQAAPPDLVHSARAASAPLPLTESHKLEAANASEPVDRRNRGMDSSALLLFVPPEKLRHFAPGNRVVLIESGQRINATVIAVEPPAVHPGALRQEFASPAEAAVRARGPRAVPVPQSGAARLTEPSAIVLIQPEAHPGALDLGEVRVEVAERRLVAMLPLVRTIFE